MSNLRVNIRILMWHFQVSDNWKCSLTYNDFHKGLKYGWFKIHYFNLFKKKICLREHLLKFHQEEFERYHNETYNN